MRIEEVLKREGFSYVKPRPNDYTRLFSVPARRPAPAHPDSPHTDKKPRSSPQLSATPPHSDEAVQLRPRNDSTAPAEDRLSASDFYTVSEDVTPQPFKGILFLPIFLNQPNLILIKSTQYPDTRTQHKQLILKLNFKLLSNFEINR